VVFDRVVGPSFQNFGDFGPFVALATVAEVEDPLLVATPLDLLDLGVQVVVPPLSALLPDPARQVLSDLGPLLGPVLLNQMEDHPVLFLSPGPLDQVGVQDLLPSVETLDVGPSRQAF
jgi:hypothetical protein